MNVILHLALLTSIATAVHKPEQIHIALGQDWHSMSVMWASHSPSSKPTVWFAQNPNNLSHTVPATANLFTQDNLKGVQNIYQALLQDLQPDTRYFYQVGACTQKSQVYSFRTLPDQPYRPRLLVFGDLGHYGGEWIHRLFTALPAMKKEFRQGGIDAVIHLGDFAYDMHNRGGRRGDDFMRRIQDMAARVPYMTVPGNHEGISGRFSHYRSRFAMPRSEINDGFEMWYSFDMDSMHFIAFSTEVFFFRNKTEQTRMINWIEEDLKTVDRSKTPWIITLGHRPMYCSNSDHDCLQPESAGEIVRENLEILFMKYRVDVQLYAHEHSYERTWPVFNMTTIQKNYQNAQAPIHIITGAAGCNEGLGACQNPILHPGGDWSAFRTGILHPYSYGHLQAFNNTHLYWDQVNSRTGEIYDSLWISKDPIF